mmetsp:Transcript_37760/g.76374  ORF Transcript_37760/g.76374 Transcript_37760/m.76374 type:complete len:207 (+) Transcript_37760:338-958(+)
MFTIQAKGDVALSSVNAVLGNLIGIFSAPAMAALTIGGRVAKQDLKAVILSLIEIIVAPLSAGLVAQIAAKKWVKLLTTENAIQSIQKCSTFILVIILYLLFCNAFSSSAHIDISNVVRLCVFVAVVHTLVLAAAWASANLATTSREQRMFFFFHGAPKDRGHGSRHLNFHFSKQRGKHWNSCSPHCRISYHPGDNRGGYGWLPSD